MSNGPTPRSAPDTVTGATRAHGSGADPHRIDRYIVIDRLGEGGMGVVLSAYDPELHRRVAIKLLRSPKQGRSQLRLIREAQSMARLSHPNVVQIYDVGTTGGQVYLAMELVVGQTIRAWLESKPRSWQEIVQQFVDAGRGLVAAHAVGLVHRDFKPENVLVADDGRVRVADFGIASHDMQVCTTESDRPEGASFLGMPITATGAIVGTPRYMAPEQHTDHEVGPEADQFSFCVALHEALFGQRPFAGRTLAELADNVAAERYQPPPDPRGVPRWISEAVRRGLKADPSQRHENLEVLLERLTDDPRRRRRRRTRAGLTGTALAASVAVAAVGWSDGPVDECSGGAKAIAQLWGPDRRDAVAGAFADADEAAVKQAGPPLQRALDQYADGWAEAHHEMCVANRDGTVSDSMLDTSMSCLERRRVGFETLVGLIDRAEAPALATAAMAAAKLPRVAECADRDLLGLDVPPPDPELAATVTELRGRIARAKVVHDTGDVEAAVTELEAVAAQTAAAGYDPLTAEAALAIGRLAMDRRDWPTARAQLQRASSRGIVSALDHVAAEARARLIYVHAAMSDDPKTGLQHQSVALSLAERAGDPAWLRALIANNVGAVHGMLGDRERAAAYFETAAALGEQSERSNALDFSGYLINLALVTRDPDRRDATFARAETLVREALGPGHIERLDYARIRAQHRVDPASALQGLSPICAQIAARRGDDPIRCHRCFWREGELNDELGDADAAGTAVRAAAECISPARVATPAPPLVEALRAKSTGYLAVLQDDGEAALAPLADAERLLGPQRELPWIALELADVTLLRGRALGGLDRGGEIVDALADALSAYEQRMQTSEDRAAHYRGARARALLQSFRSMP